MFIIRVRYESMLFYDLTTWQKNLRSENLIIALPIRSTSYYIDMNLKTKKNISNSRAALAL